jgi:hypothetical protein
MPKWILGAAGGGGSRGSEARGSEARLCVRESEREYNVTHIGERGYGT